MISDKLINEAIASVKNLADILFENNNFEESSKLYLEILNFDINNSHAYNMLEIIEGHKGNLIKSKSYLNQAHKINPIRDINKLRSDSNNDEPIQRVY